MSELTKLTLTEARDGLAAGDFTAVELADALTPSIIAGVLQRARLFAHKAAIALYHAAKAFAREIGLLAERIASHARTGDIGMLVPRLADAGGLQLKPVFDPEAVRSQAGLSELLVTE